MTKVAMLMKPSLLNQYQLLIQSSMVGGNINVHKSCIFINVVLHGNLGRDNY